MIHLFNLVITSNIPVVENLMSAEVAFATRGNQCFIDEAKGLIVEHRSRRTLPVRARQLTS